MTGPRDWTDAGPQDVPDRDPNEGDPFADDEDPDDDVVNTEIEDLDDDLDHGACVMEAVAFLAGEKWSDHPECASPALGDFLRSWNDGSTDEQRQELKQYIPRLVGSKGTKAQESERRWMAADWLIRAAEERDVLRDLLSQAFFTLQGMEIVWNHEQGCDRFAASMQRYADSAVRLEGLIEPMLNKLGVETSFKLTGCRREAPKAGEEKTQ